VQALLQGRTAGVVKIWISTRVDNISARRLLESNGAKLVEETYAEYVYVLD